MVSPLATLFVSFPVAHGEMLHWWYVRDGETVSNGCDNDPLLAAKLKLQTGETEIFSCVAIMPSAQTVVRWHDPIPDVTEKQAVSASILNARKASLQPDLCHVAAISDGDGQIVTAAAGQGVIATGLADLQQRGLDPDIIVPVGWLVPPNTNTLIAADFGFDEVLRGDRIIAPDEPELREHLIGASTVDIFDKDATKQLLARADPSSLLNLRTGIFAKKIRQAIGSREKRILTWMAIVLLIISLAIPTTQLVRYYWATDDADEQAIAVAQPIVGNVDDPETAERQLDEKLISENRGNVIFAVPASALFSAVQQTPGVSIGRLSYRQDGLVAAELSAVRNEDINPALIALQNAGFVVTATPRTDATGIAKADITVRAP